MIYNEVHVTMMFIYVQVPDSEDAIMKLYVTLGFILLIALACDAKSNKKKGRIVKRGFSFRNFWKSNPYSMRKPKLFDCTPFSMCEPVAGSGNYARDGTKFACCKTCEQKYKQCSGAGKKKEKRNHRAYRCRQESFACLCNCQCTLKG